MKPVYLYLCVLFVCLGRAAHSQALLRPIAISGVEAIGMTVSDMDRSIAFYTGILTFTKASDVEVAGDAYEHLKGVFGLRMRVVRLKLGDETLELTQFLTPAGRPVPPDSRSNDHWFQHISIIVSDMDKAYARLRANHVGYVSAEPQRLPNSIKGAAGIEAFYFRDPDNHTLEILHFPPNKGDPRWHRANAPLFRGIDHSAIVVTDTEASLNFYRDTLGMKVMGVTENYGMEQEHLNAVFGARLRITSLRAASGPGIELLEYQAPRDGRPIPLDARANDLDHWQTEITTGEASLKEGFPTSLVALPDAALGFRFGADVADPDGHIIEMIVK